MKILAVDDDPIILDLLSEVLGAIGYTNVRFAGSGTEALALVSAETVPFDCLLLDIQMPEMDGMQLTAALRALPDYARTPILMITAMSERSYIDAAFAAGATDYVTKPFEIGELNARIRLIETLVNERKLLNDRNPVAAPADDGALAAPAPLDEPLHVEDIDGVIDYLALENYLLQMSRASFVGQCAFAVAISDFSRIFAGASLYEYRCAVTDVAEAISECLKPHRFFVAHAGGGVFACVRDAGRHFDPAVFARELSEKIREMDLYHCDGRPMVLHPAVGAPIQLDLKSPRGAAKALVEARARAEIAAEGPLGQSDEGTGGFRALFGWTM